MEPGLECLKQAQDARQELKHKKDKEMETQLLCKFSLDSLEKWDKQRTETGEGGWLTEDATKKEKFWREFKRFEKEMGAFMMKTYPMKKQPELKDYLFFFKTIIF